MSKYTKSALLALLLLGCDPDTAADASAFRAGYWSSVECSSGTCWGLHPLAADDDLWARLIRRDQIVALVASGRYTFDATGAGFGAGSCAAGKYPTTTPIAWCFNIAGTPANRCFGGDGKYFTEIKPACAALPGFAAANTDYAPGSCDVLPQMPWDVFDLMMGHNTKMNVARVGLDGDSFMLYPGCAL